MITRRTIRVVLAAAVLASTAPHPALAGVQRWTSRGPEGASILSLATDPTRPDILYAGAVSAEVNGYGVGIVKSVDGGANWAPSSSGFGASFAQILIDPADPDRVYARAQAADGRVFVGTNGGATWQPLLLGAPAFCLGAGGGAAGTVLYACTNGRGVLKSTDSGATWSSTGLEGYAFSLAVVDPGNPDTAYVSEAGFSDSFRTQDGGLTWQRLLNVSVLALDPQSPRTVYALGQQTILKSTDAGATWSPTGIGTLVEFASLTVDPSDGSRLYVATPQALWRSSDGGATWTSAANGYFDAVTALAFDPRNPAVVYAGRRSTGVYRSTDHAATLLPVNHGLSLTDIYALAIGSRRSGPLYADSSSCLHARSDDGGRTWCCLDITLADAITAVDPADPLTVYGFASVGGDVRYLQRSRDGGLTWAVLPGPELDAQQIAFDPQDSSVLYAFDPGLLRSADYGATWTSISSGIPYAPVTSPRGGPPPDEIDSVRSFAVDPQTPSTLYATSYRCLYYPNRGCQEEASALSKSLDAGHSWSAIPLPPEVEDVRVQVPPHDPGTIYVSTDNGIVYRSRDDGISWTLLTSTLDLLYFDPSSASTLYGISRGSAVLRSTDGGVTWLPFGDGLEGILVTDLVVDPSGVVLRASTLGAGVQEYEFGSPTARLSTAPGEDFVVSVVARDQRTGRTGNGLAVSHADDFAWFSLPGLTGNVDNPEIFVKVVDGRPINGHFWVFYGGLTDVEFTVQVAQSSSALSRTYVKPAGSACGEFDVAAFPSGSGPGPSAPPAAACTPESELLLNPGRSFHVRLAATDQRTGRTTAGVAAAESDAFGFFSLPDFTGSLSNPEVFVKIVDGRAYGGHFWVFFGGLTDVEYALTVTDSVTGTTRTYTKQAGSTCGGFDTATFGE